MIETGSRIRRHGGAVIVGMFDGDLIRVREGGTVSYLMICSISNNGSIKGVDHRGRIHWTHRQNVERVIYR